LVDIHCAIAEISEEEKEGRKKEERRRKHGTKI